MNVSWGFSIGGLIRLPGDTVVWLPERLHPNAPSPDSLNIYFQSGPGTLQGFLHRDGADYVGLAQWQPRELAKNILPLNLRLERAQCGTVGPEGVTLAGSRRLP